MEFWDGTRYIRHIRRGPGVPHKTAIAALLAAGGVASAFAMLATMPSVPRPPVVAVAPPVGNLPNALVPPDLPASPAAPLPIPTDSPAAPSATPTPAPSFTASPLHATGDDPPVRPPAPSSPPPTIGGANGAGFVPHVTASPHPTPSHSSPSPSFTSTPSPRPSLSSPTPTPSPSASVEPTATPSISPNPSPSPSAVHGRKLKERKP